jgi:hypothetical protein
VRDCPCCRPPPPRATPPNGGNEKPERQGAVPLRELLRLFLLRLGIRDVTGGHKMWRSTVLDGLWLNKVRRNGCSFQVEMNHRARLRGPELVKPPLRLADRAEGESTCSASLR